MAPRGPSRDADTTTPAFLRRHLLRACGALVVLGVVAAGLIAGRGPDSSAETAVQTFLLDWQEGNYLAAGQLTNGSPATVAAELKAAHDQLDAAALYLSIGTISQRGDTAHAQFGASVDVGEAGTAWTYTGHFTLDWTGSAWKVRWSPSVIVPGLRPGTRLAVRSTMPPRAPVLDSAGQPLQQPSATYVAGVRPARLADPVATAAAFGRATGLDAGQVLDQIRSAQGDLFLTLLTLDAGSSARMRARLAGVPGLIVKRVRQRLFTSLASDVVGSVGAEDAVLFRENGIPYQPGATTGLSGLQQYYQHRLAGTPSSEVIVEDDSGHVVQVLHRWPGLTGQPVRTTLSAAAQAAADRALGGTGDAAAIVAMQASSGRILAVASRPARGGRIAQPNPLTGHYPPGQAFTIVSTAALLDSGLSVGDPVPCTSASDVGGQTFTNDPPARGLGSLPSFRTDFARGCGTAFAGLSRRLSATGLSRAATGFGLGSSWRLPLSSFAGSMPTPSDDAQVAADTIGSGNVQVSPLDMALIAAQVDSGQQHVPSLVISPAVPDPPLSPRYQLSAQVMGTLRTLMRTAVRTGAARGADLPGQPVYGQAGQAPFSENGTTVRAAWFVGFRGDVAFAVLDLGTARDTSAVALAARFLHRLAP